MVEGAGRESWDPPTEDTNSKSRCSSNSQTLASNWANAVRRYSISSSNLVWSEEPRCIKDPGRAAERSCSGTIASASNSRSTTAARWAAIPVRVQEQGQCRYQWAQICCPGQRKTEDLPRWWLDKDSLLIQGLLGCRDQLNFGEPLKQTKLVNPLPHPGLTAVGTCKLDPLNLARAGWTWRSLCVSPLVRLPSLPQANPVFANSPRCLEAATILLAISSVAASTKV